MLARLKEILRQVFLIGPWVLILIVASLALITPGILQDLLTNIAQSALLPRLVLVALIYGALGLGLYRRYPQYFERVMPKRAEKAGAVPKVETGSATAPSLERVTSLFSRKASAPEVVESEAVAMQSASTEQNSPAITPKNSDTSSQDMSEDEFYAFLDSVAEDKNEGSS